MDKNGWSGEEDAKVLVFPGQGCDKHTGPNWTHPTPNLHSCLTLTHLPQRGGPGRRLHLTLSHRGLGGSTNANCIALQEWQ